MKFFKRFFKCKHDPSLEMKVAQLQSICIRHYTGVKEWPNGSVSGFVHCKENLDDTVKKLSEKIDMIMDHLEIEIHKPDCKLTMRKRTYVAKTEKKK